MPNCPYCGKQFKRRNALNHHVRYSCKSKSNNNDDNNNNNNKRKRKSPIRTTYGANHIRSRATGKHGRKQHEAKQHEAKQHEAKQHKAKQGKQGKRKRDLDQEKNDLETMENTIDDDALRERRTVAEAKQHLVDKHNVLYPNNPITLNDLDGKWKERFMHLIQGAVAGAVLSHYKYLFGIGDMMRDNGHTLKHTIALIKHQVGGTILMIYQFSNYRKFISIKKSND